MTRVSATNVTVRYDDGGDVVDYPLIKFLRSNHGTCINQRPIVSLRDRVKPGGMSSRTAPRPTRGRSPLGKNILMGFMTWEGYNYEDAVLLNERMVKDDVFTSIHIEEYEVEARDTKLGPEEITRDIPNVGDDALKDLDESGALSGWARRSTRGHPGGQGDPQGETDLTAEERLLRAIFGEKAREVRDTSLKVPHGERHHRGREGLYPGGRRRAGPRREHGGAGLHRPEAENFRGRQDGRPPRQQGRGLRIMPQEDMPFLPDGTPLDIVLNPLGVPSRMNIGQVLEVHLGRAAQALGWKGGHTGLQRRG